MSRDWNDGLPASELPEGGMLAGRLGDDDILLVNDAGEIHAIGATCTHYGGPLVDGAVIDGTIRCPWHHACFDLKSGAVERAPALMPLAKWRVERRGDRLFIGERVEPEAPPRVVQPESVVIVGMGASGVSVADTLRRSGYDGRIVMISGETELPYDKPNLSKDFLAGHASADWLPLHPAEYYAEQKVELRLGTTVSSIDPRAKQIATSEGESISYGALVLATGAAPRKLAVPGSEHVRYLRTRHDAEALIAGVASATRAIVIGAGFIGLETAASLRQRDLNVTVVSPDSAPLQRIVGDEVSARIRAIHEAHGVVFVLGRSVVGIEPNAVLLDDGSRLEGDLIVAGIGVAPSVDLARAAGLAVDNGITVNEQFETTEPGIWACGDVAAWPDVRTGARTRVEHWVVAGRQGQTVARNILGHHEPFAAVPLFWSAHFDTSITCLGNFTHWDTIEVDGSLEKNDATVVYRHATKIVAIATMGRDHVSLAAESAMERGDWVGLNGIVKG